MTTELNSKIYNKNYIIDLLFNKIVDNKESLRHSWNNPTETTTHHFLIDHLLPDEICTAIYAAFPKDGNGFFSLDSFREKKKTSVNLNEYDPILANITYAFQDPKIVGLISEICGFTEIEPDPMLYAGGLSMMFQNDFLNPHLDNSHDGKRNRYRRLNLLYYVSPEWETKNGGNFELWNESRTKAKTLTSQTNRLIVMETNKLSWHSVSKVMIDRPRCCVSNYYFSKISPDNTNYFHVTSFTGRPGENVKKIIGVFDNALRNIASKTLKIGRGKSRIHVSKDGQN